jgi:hypothetical protein
MFTTTEAYCTLIPERRIPSSNIPTRPQDRRCTRKVIPRVRPKIRIQRQCLQPRLQEYVIAEVVLMVDNVASLKLWDQLGFTRVGVIPGAGRLRSGPGGEEEYVDAVIIHKSFV